MTIKSCIPVIPSGDLAKSLRFWVEGLGLTADREMLHEGRLIGCMVHNEHTYFWLNFRRAGKKGTCFIFRKPNNPKRGRPGLRNISRKFWMKRVWRMSEMMSNN